LAEAKQEYSDVAGIDAASELANTHATYNKDQGATKKHFNTATMEFLEQSRLMREQETNWFDLATNCDLDDGSKGVCRLKQTCTPTGAARKWVTTITDVHILNYAVSLDTCRITTNTQGVWKCKLPLTSLPLQRLVKSALFMFNLPNTHLIN